MKADMPEGFKETEIGLIPEDWEVKSLGEFNMSDKSSLNPLNYPDDIFEYYSIPAYQEGQHPILVKGSDIMSQKIVLKDKAVLFGKLNPRVEKVWRVQSNSAYKKIGSTEWIPIFPKPFIYSDYVYFLEWSSYVMPIAKGLISGSTPSRQRVDPTAFYKIKVPLPPLPEQQKIAAVLSAVQEAKEKTENVLSALKELKKSMMKHLFTYGAVSYPPSIPPYQGGTQGGVRLKETEIGMIPEHWEVRKLSQLFEIQQGKALAQKHKKGISPHPFLRTANVFWGRVDLNNVDWMDFTSAEIDKLALRDGDLLVCEGGDIGRTAIWRGQIERCCYQNHLHRLRPKVSDAFSPFYMYWMQASILLLGLYVGTGNKTTIPNLSRGRLSEYLLPLPPLSEQHQIAETLSAIDDKIEAEQTKKSALDALFKSLLSLLMTGKIRVKDLEI